MEGASTRPTFPLLDFPLGEFTDNIAVFLQPTNEPNLVPRVLHAASVLGSTTSVWPVVVLTVDSSQLLESASLRRAVKQKRIFIQPLPAGLDIPDRAAVSMFLASPWLWQRMAAANRILLFGPDSILCANSNSTVDDYVEFDMIGIPGSLSLLNPKLFLEATQRLAVEERGRGQSGASDEGFYSLLQDMGANLPSLEISKSFLAEKDYSEAALGYVQSISLPKGRARQIHEWCPEAGLIEH